MEEQPRFAIEITGLEPGKMTAVTIGGNTILLANVGGRVYATSDSCTHDKCSLHDGKLKGKVLTCPCHSAQFDVTTGAVLAPPAREPLQVYKVTDGPLMSGAWHMISLPC